VTPNNIAQELRQGDIIYFVHLHLDRVRKLRKAENYRNTYVYEVEGKARPMIILDELRGEQDGVTWFRVLKLSRGRSPQKQRPGHRRIGPLLEDGIDSFVDCHPHSYPDNLIAGDVIKRLDRLQLTSILAIIGFKLGPPLR